MKLVFTSAVANHTLSRQFIKILSQRKFYFISFLSASSQYYYKAGYLLESHGEDGKEHIYELKEHSQYQFQKYAAILLKNIKE